MQLCDATFHENESPPPEGRCEKTPPIRRVDSELRGGKGGVNQMESIARSTTP